MQKNNLSGQEFWDTKQNKIYMVNSFKKSLQLAVTAPRGSQHKSPSLKGQYLEKPGVKKERVGGLRVIVTVQVKIAEFVQVSVWGHMLSYQM